MSDAPAQPFFPVKLVPWTTRGGGIVLSAVVGITLGCSSSRDGGFSSTGSGGATGSGVATGTGGAGATGSAGMGGATGSSGVGGAPGAGGMSSATGAGGAGGVGDTGATSSGSGGHCVTVQDCVGMVPSCDVVSCVSGLCTLTTVPDGTPAAMQTPGDCLQSICAGGALLAAPDPADTPVSSTPCLVGVCTNGVPALVPAALGTACNLNGGTACDGSGNCAPATCSDGLKNEGESDVDCGGPCPPCADGKTCGTGTDCASLVCSGGLCISGCADGLQDGLETGVDCGGPVCTGCADGEPCARDRDCGSTLCSGGVCAPDVVDCTALEAFAPGAVVWTTQIAGVPPAPSSEFPFWFFTNFAVGSTGRVFYTTLYQDPLGPVGPADLPSSVSLGEIDSAGAPVSSLVVAADEAEGFTGTVAVFGAHHWVVNAWFQGSDNSQFDQSVVSDTAQRSLDTTGETQNMFTGTGNAAGDVFVLDQNFSPNSLERIDSTGTNAFVKPLPDAPVFAGFRPDDAGDVYLEGTLQGTVDYGCGPIAGAGPYVAKLDPSGACLWSRAGYVWPGGAHDYFTGTFLGTLDVGCGPMTSAAGGTSDSSYVAQLDPTGTCVWSRVLPGATLDITIMPSGSPLVTAPFSGTVDAGCGPMSSSSGTYLAMLDATGACTWSHASDVPGVDVAAFPSGDVLASAPFTGTVDLGGGLLTSVGAQDFALARLDGATGAAVWSHAYGGAGATLTASAVPDATGAIYLTAESNGGTVDFGGGPIAAGAGYILKLDGSAGFRFQQVPNGTPALDPCGAVIVVAYPFEACATCGPGGSGGHAGDDVSEIRALRGAERRATGRTWRRRRRCRRG
jgi:hypothetical protein